jgi:hypothetical protein
VQAEGWLSHRSQTIPKVGAACSFSFAHSFGSLLVHMFLLFLGRRADYPGQQQASKSGFAFGVRLEWDPDFGPWDWVQPMFGNGLIWCALDNCINGRLTAFG